MIWYDEEYTKAVADWNNTREAVTNSEVSKKIFDKRRKSRSEFASRRDSATEI